MSDHEPEIRALLKHLTVNWRPEAGDMAQAPIIDGWECRLAPTGRHLQIVGRVVGSSRFGTGEPIVTSAVAGVTPGGSPQWIKTQNTLYRLGWPAGANWPPALQAAACPNWKVAHEAVLNFTGDHTIPNLVIAGAWSAAHKDNDWDIKRGTCHSVAVELHKAGREDVARAWWLLATDLMSDRDRQFAEITFAHVLKDLKRAPNEHEQSALRGWNTLAGCTDESINDYGDLNDPIAAAHRAAAEDPDLTSGDARELARKDARALPFFVALEPSHKRARERVMEAVRSVLTGDDVGDLVVGADAIADQKSDLAAAKLVPPYIKWMTAWGRANNVPLALSDHELHRALIMVSVDSHERMHDLARLRSSVGFIREAAGEAVDLGLISRARAQLTVCAWSLLALGLTAVGQDPADHTDDPFAMAHRIADQLTNDIRVAAPSPFPPAIAAHFALRTGGKTPAEGPAEGVMVMAAAGGTTETTSAKEVVREFKKMIGKRIPVTRPPADMPATHAALAAEFPHLIEQIDNILEDLAGADAVRLRPTLLVGEAGGGKSRLARRLAEVLKVGLHRFDAAGSGDNAFGGTPRRWSSGEHCVPLEAIRRHGIANPIVLVDEIDKAGKSKHNGSLAEALMPFLDPETSRNFPDPFVQTDCDLSHVSYILTANKDEDLPAPLKDRLRILRLPKPTIEHLPALARGIVADVARRKGGDARWWPALDEGEIDVAEKLWPGGSVRKLRSVVERILAYRERGPSN